VEPVDAVVDPGVTEEQDEHVAAVLTLLVYVPAKQEEQAPATTYCPAGQATVQVPVEARTLPEPVPPVPPIFTITLVPPPVP